MSYFDLAQREYGAKVFVWNQAWFIEACCSDTDKKLLGSGSNGICLSLSCKWIACQEMKENFQNTIMIDSDKEEVLLLNHEIEIEKDRQKKLGRVDEYFLCYGLKMSDGLFREDEFNDIVWFKKIIRGASPQYMNRRYLCISITGKGGHTMAVDARKHCFFDPNRGEAIFKNNEDMAAFIFTFVHVTYPYQTKEWFIEMIS